VRRMSSHRAHGCRPTQVTVCDSPSAWATAGFAVAEDGTVQVGDFRIFLTGAQQQRGASSWSFRDLPLAQQSRGELCGVPLQPTAGTASTQQPHANGVVRLDHIVLRCPDAAVAQAELQAVGIDLRRQTLNEKTRTLYSFYRPGFTILEILSPHPADKPSGAERGFIWGLTFSCSDLDATHRFLGNVTRPPWPAMQKGRRITTLDTKSLDISLKIAFMTPHVK
jgi:hypothetical protein